MSQRLPQSVRNLGRISFFTDFASGMAYPVAPLFPTEVLGAPVAVLGLTEGVGKALISVHVPEGRKGTALASSTCVLVFRRWRAA